MRQFSLTIYKRDFSEPIAMPDVEFSVEEYSHSDRGGPWALEVTARGREQNVWDLTKLLRNFVVISNDRGQPVWWGIFDEIEVHGTDVDFTVSLEPMSNRVKAAYTYREPGTQGATSRGTTSWAEDADSTAKYGEKELILSLSNVEEGEANKQRDNKLEELKAPIVRDMELQFGGGEESEATLYGIGLFRTLEWKYYSNSAGFEKHEGDNEKTFLSIGRPEDSTTEIGFKAAGSAYSIYNFDSVPDFGMFKPGDTFDVSGSTSNDGLYTVAQTFEQAARTEGPSTQIGFMDDSKGYRIIALADLLTDIITGAFIRVSGSADNDGVYQASSANLGGLDSESSGTDIGVWAEAAWTAIFDISGGLQFFNADDVARVVTPTQSGFWPVKDTGQREYRSYTNNTIYFDATGEYIYDTSNGLGIFEKNDIILVSNSGKATNDKHWRVIEVEPDGSRMKLSQNPDDTSAGSNVTIEAGNYIEMPGGSLSKELPSATFTISRTQYVFVQEELTPEPDGNSVTLDIGASIKVNEAVANEIPGDTVTISPVANKLWQAIDTGGSDMWAVYANIIVGKVGNPTDNLEIILDNATKGTQVTASVAGSDIVASGSVKKFVFSPNLDINQVPNGVFMEAADNVRLIIQRSGANSADDYYTVQIEKDGSYPDGNLLFLYNGAYETGTDTFGQSSDMPFKLVGTWQLDRQIEQILDTAGQFFSGHTVFGNTILANPYRDGDSDALYEMIELLDRGTQNDRRLRAETTRQRYVHVTEAPGPEQEIQRLRLDNQNRLTNYADGEVDKTLCPVGIWVELKGFNIPELVRKEFNPSPIYVSEAVYKVKDDKWEPLTSIRQSVWGIGETRQG